MKSLFVLKLNLIFFKLYNYSKFGFKIILGSIFAIIIFALSFFIKIRLYKIHYFLGATQYLQIYIYEKKAGLHKNYLDIFVLDKYLDISLKKSKKYNRTFLKIIISEILVREFNFNIFKFPFHFIGNCVFDFLTYFQLNKYIIPINTHSLLYDNYKINFEILKSPTPIDNKTLRLLEKKYSNFKKKFSDLNFKKLITYANRDSAYKAHQISDFDFSYHNFRDFSPNVFKPTIEKFCKYEYLNLRIGNVTKQELSINNSFFFDYSKSKYICEELDIYLIYKSKFFVGTGSGLDKIAAFFKIPILYINPINLSYLPHYYDNCVVIPNIYIDLDTNKKILFKDQIDPYFKKDIITGNNLSKYDKTDEFIRNNVKMIFNNEDDILAGSNEINLLSENKLILNKYDQELQNTFWDNIKIKKITKNFIISPSFLRKNLDLFS